MREFRLRNAFLAFALVAGCTPTNGPEPQPGRTFAPRILAIPSGSYIRVEVASNQFGTSMNSVYVVDPQMVPVSAGSLVVNGLPGGPLYFRVSGIDADRTTPLWATSGGIPDGDAPALAIGGPDGMTIHTPSAPTLGLVSTTATNGNGMVQIQCSNGAWPHWTTNGNPPDSKNPGMSNSGTMSTATTEVGNGTTVWARCTDGYSWSPSNNWTYASAFNTTDDAILPQVQFQPYSGNSGNLGFVLPAGASTAPYSNWQVIYQIGSGSKTLIPFSSPCQSNQISGTNTVTAYFVAWDGTRSKWVGGVKNTISLPFIPPFGGILPAPTISIPFSTGGTVNFAVPSGVSGNYQNWSVMIKTSMQPDVWSQNPVSPMFNFNNLGSNSTISAYYVAWDNTNSKWETSPVSTASTTSTIPPYAPNGPLPKLQINAVGGSSYVSFTQPSGPQTSSYTDWKAVVQMNWSGNWEQKSLTESFPYSGGNATMVGYLAAWNPATSSWVTGPLDTISVSAYTVSLNSPAFMTNFGNPLSGTYLLDSNAIAIQINLSGTAAQILYTTDGSDPVPGTSPSWNGATGNIPFPPEKDSVVVKAMAVNGNQISPVSSLSVKRPSWTRVDLATVGCLRQVGATKVYACGDARGPLTWQSNAWVPVDATWSHGTVQSLFVSDTEMVAVVGAQVWRALRTGTFMPLGTPLPSGPVHGVARWGDSLWAGTNDGIYEWTGSSWNPVPGTPSGTTQLWAGSDALWAGAGNQVWRLYWSGTGRTWAQWTNTSGNVTGFIENPWYMGGSNGPLALSMDALSEIDLAHMALTGNAITDALPAHQGLRQAYNWNSRLYAAFNNGNGVGGIAKTTGWGAGWTRVGTGWPSQGSTPSGAIGLAVFKNQSAQLIASTPSGTWTIPLP